MWVKQVVVLEPFWQRADNGGGVGLWIDSDVIALERTHESLAIPFDCGLSTGVVNGKKPISLAKLRVSIAV